MQSSKEYQEEIRKPSSAIIAKKQNGNAKCKCKMQMQNAKQQNGKDQRSLQENQRYKGNISSKDGLNKDTNNMDLTEAEDIKKRW